MLLDQSITLDGGEGARLRTRYRSSAACGVARLPRVAKRTAEFSPRRRRTTRRARSRSADRPEVRLAVASSPSPSPSLAPRRCAQRPNLRHAGWRSSSQRDLQLASVQPQRSPPHASLAQDSPTRRHLLDVRSDTLADSSGERAGDRAEWCRQPLLIDQCGTPRGRYEFARC